MRVALALFLLTALVQPPAQAEDMRIIRGTVVKQIHGCEVDGTCSVLIKTPQGEVEVIWGQGDVVPDPACPNNKDAMKAAADLKPGQNVEIHLPASSNVLCGDKAKVVLPGP